MPYAQIIFSRSPATTCSGRRQIRRLPILPAPLRCHRIEVLDRAVADDADLNLVPSDQSENLHDDLRIEIRRRD